MSMDQGGDDAASSDPEPDTQAWHPEPDEDISGYEFVEVKHAQSPSEWANEQR